MCLRILRSSLLLTAIGAMCGPLLAQQGVVTLRTLSIDTAITIAQATLRECRDKGFATAVVVVDRAGQVLVTLRDEKAPPQTAEMARRKAYTAHLFRGSTLDFARNTEGNGGRAAQRDVADVLALGGGVPIYSRMELIGGVGSSGSSPEQDDACSRAGIAKVAERLN